MPVEPPKERLLEVVDLVRFVKHQWLVILGAALAAAAITGCVVLWSPARYEASATLVVVPLTFKSQLNPPALPIQGYQRLLESDAVIAETTQRLVAKGTIEEERGLRLGKDLTSRIFVSRRAEENTLAPVIEAVGYGTTAEEAATVANTWVEVFLARNRLLLNNSLSPTLEFIDDQYQEERSRLESLEQQLLEVTKDYEQRLDDATRTWDRRLIDASKKTEDLVASYNNQTRQQMQELAAQSGLDLEAARGPNESIVDGEMSKRLLQILSLRIQLAQTPRVLVLEKAISDDTLWQVLTLSALDENEIQPVLSQRLQTQEANPVYDELTLKLSQVELDLGPLSSMESRKVQQFSSRLEELQGQRSAGLTKLLAERAMALGRLEKQKTLEIGTLRREKKARIDRLRRDIDHQTSLYAKLASNYNEATLARAEQGAQDVRLGAPAVAPLKPERKVLRKTLVAALVGGLFGLLAALVREWGSPATAPEAAS